MPMAFGTRSPRLPHRWDGTSSVCAPRWVTRTTACCSATSVSAPNVILGRRPHGPNSSQCPEPALREHEYGGRIEPKGMDHCVNGAECRVAPVVQHVAERRAVDVGSCGELLVCHVRDDSCAFDLANI